MNGKDFIKMIEQMDNLTSLIHEGKDGLKFQFIRHTGGWDVWTMKGVDNIGVHKFDKIAEVNTIIVFYNKDIYVGALTKNVLGVE